MKTIHLLIAFMFLFAPVRAQFEGILHFTTENTAAQEKARIEWKMKNNEHRLEVSSTTPEHNTRLSLLMQSNQWYLISEPAFKTYFKLNPEAAELVYSTHYYRVAADPIFEDVSGFKAQKVYLESDQQVVVCYVSQDFPLQTNQLPMIFQQSKGILNALAKNGIKGFPIRIQVMDKQGQLVYNQTLVKVENKIINSSEFRLPSDYQDGTDRIEVDVK